MLLNQPVSKPEQCEPQASCSEGSRSVWEASVIVSGRDPTQAEGTRALGLEKLSGKGCGLFRDWGEFACGAASRRMVELCSDEASRSAFRLSRLPCR